jgi:hypothetical protein
LAGIVVDNIEDMQQAWKSFGNFVIDTVLKEIAKELIKQIGLAKTLKGALGIITGGIGGLIGGLFAQQGVTNFVVPPGFPDDTFPIHATSGEIVNIAPAGTPPARMGATNNFFVSFPPLTSRQAAKELGKIAGQEIYKEISVNRKIG